MNEELKKPMQPNEIEWRIQNSRNNKTTVVPYLQNRAVMERLDEAFAPGGWQNTYERWGAKGVKCGIGVLCDAEWVWKYDGADETDIEPTKGGFSDSMKRCAVQWGLGRDLYKYPRVFIEGEHKYIPDWANEMLDKLVEAFIAGKLEGRSVIVLKQK
jgi:hypothetical protein